MSPFETLLTLLPIASVEVGSAAQPVKGFNYFQLNDACQIDTMSIEFNSIAWGADTGFTTTPPSGPPPS